MTQRTAHLRKLSLEARPSISHERAVLLTDFYRENDGKFSIPVMRARSFQHLCQHKTIYIGEGELIVGERGPLPKAVPTYPELTCHSVEDLHILNSRPKTSYAVSDECIQVYAKEIIPYWRGRSMRDKIFAGMSAEWLDAYNAGLFTEFMEQRAPGHTVLDGKIYRQGMLDFKRDIAEALARLDYLNDAEAYAKREQLMAMDISCDAMILFAHRHAELASELAKTESNPARKAELEKIAEVCTHVPARAPRDFHEALQYYWFCHLAIITELNGWDSFSPGHLDQHLLPFYRVAHGSPRINTDNSTPVREDPCGSVGDFRELLECFFVKFNNHPAPPKVGVTAEESGTYTDFANVNLAGMLSDGSDGSNELTHLLLEVIDEMHLLQPSSNLQLSRKTPDAVLKHTLRILRNGYGFPSIFNADAVVEEQLRQGKTLADARAGGCSGCVETGAFGKEAYILTGYFNLVKILELTLHDGVDPRTGKQLGLKTQEDGPRISTNPHESVSDPCRSVSIRGQNSICTFDELFAAFRRQVQHFIDIKLRGNQIIEQMYARLMPAPFLSVITDDCIAKGKDYNDGGARYNNSYIQFVGIGSLADSLAAIRQLVYAEKALALSELVSVLDANFEANQPLRQRLLNRMPKYGNDDDAADDLAVATFDMLFDLLDGRPNSKGGCYRVEMLPTTCHVYFGSVTGAMPDGRPATMPLSEGISPVQGADRHGPTAVIKSAAKMDHIKAGGALLNMKFTPSLLADEDGIEKLAHLVRSYFKMDGHHVQFNVVTAGTLRQAQASPEAHRDLIVRVAGYSDYFCDLSRELQDEIIARTEHASL